MKRDSFGLGLAVAFVMVCVVLVIGSIGVASEPKTLDRVSKNYYYINEEKIHNI